MAGARQPGLLKALGAPSGSGDSGGNASWPNEPAGLTVFSNADVGFDQDIPTSGDQPVSGMSPWNAFAESQGHLARVTDAGAPFSPSNVLKGTYPSGFTMGPGVGKLYFSNTAVKETYVGMVWKFTADVAYTPSDSGNQKIIYALWNQAAGSFLALEMGGTTSPFRFQCIPVNFPVDRVYKPADSDNGPGTTNTPVTIGTWYRVEWYFKYHTTSSPYNGIFKWWVSSWNGSAWSTPQLNGLWTNIQYPANAGGDFFQIYTGLSGSSSIPNAQQVWYDHVRVSHG